MNKAVFIDKDGTLIPDIPYNTAPHLIQISNHAIQGLKELKRQGFLLIVISNQAGVAKGYFTVEALEGVKDKITELLKEHDISLDGFYFCPHHPEGNIDEYSIACHCRKPEPGMILKAAKDFDVDLSRSWMIGDILNDVEAGKKAGCKTVLIDNNNETEWLINEFRRPDLTVKTLNEAADYIIKPIKIFNHEHSIS